MCVVTLEAYKSAVHGGGVNASSLPTSGSSVFGWIERDGLIANSATDDSEIVYYQDTVQLHEEVHINPCYTWYVASCSCDCIYRVGQKTHHFTFVYIFTNY